MVGIAREWEIKNNNILITVGHISFFIFLIARLITSDFPHEQSRFSYNFILRRIWIL